ncbi:MAG: flagellar basal body L-ring protein FlgH [Acidobacteriota bacterium]
MKLRTIFILAIVLLTAAGVSAQGKKKSKKNLKKDQPNLSVVQVRESPPVAPVVEREKPANGSLYTDGTVNGNLLRDFKARQIGDLVFVDVVETSTATVASSAARKRDSGNVAGLVPLLSALPVNGAATAGSVVSELGQRKFEGNGTTDRTSSVKARIAARVVEVLPNGDLRIEAVKIVKINRETEQIALTGIVRQNDLRSDNSVKTISIGDLRVEFNGKGIASADNAPGWLFRLFDKVSPF